MATLEDDELLKLIKKLVGSRGGDINDFDQEYVEPTANENYGYINKPGFMGLTGMLPGPMGVASRVTSGMINQGNNQAIRRARESMGLPNEKPSFLRDLYQSPKDGKIADIDIAGKTYPVGFEAKDKEGKTTLTPNEARMRSLANGGMSEQPKKQSTLDKVKNSVFGHKEDDESNHLHAGFGLANTPDGFRHIDDPDLPTRNMATLDYDLEGKGRSQVPSSGIGNKVADVVTDLLGPGYGVSVTSGQEPEGAKPVGTAHRHPGGFAADLKITDPNGRVLSLDNPDDAKSIKDVAQGMAARYGANFGMGEEYMGPNTMHIDTMDLSKYPGGPEWASKGKEWAGTLDEARATGVMPSQYYDVTAPVPTERPEDRTMIAENEEKKETNSPFSAVMSTPSKQENSFSIDPNRFKDVTNEQKELMATTLAGEIDPGKTDLTTEAGRREAMGILSTMENRQAKYGGIENAITAPNQYSTWNNDAAANTAANNYKANKNTYDTLVSDYISNPQNNLGFTSYHANTVNPGWSGALQNKETIGPHTFGFISEYSTSKDNFNSVTPHTVFNTTASYAPHMTGSVSEVNANRYSQPQTKANTPATTMSDTKETTSVSTGFSSGGSGFGAGSTSSGSKSGMTGTDAHAGKDKDDKVSNGFSGGRSY